MPQCIPARRVVLVVLDGLRPDAVAAFDLDVFRRLSLGGAYTYAARTVSPSVTAAAMASLLTGVPPHHHGLTSDHFHLPRPRGGVQALPRVLDDAGLPVSTFVRELPRLYRPLARAMASRLGVRHPHFGGSTAAEILAAARTTLQQQREGLIVLHWPDADVAGHEHGWMSREYGVACRALDVALGDLATEAGLFDDPSTLLIALADHGGGGIVVNDHEGDHPLNTTIPLFLTGWGVQPGRLGTQVTLLDIPRTISWFLGVAPASCWTGRVLAEAFPHAKAA